MSFSRLEILRGPPSHPGVSLAPDPATRLAPWLARPFLPHRASFASLSRETDSALFSEGLLSLALTLEGEGRLDLAQELYSLAATLPSGARARRRLDAILGQGDPWGRAEFLGRRLAREATDPAAIFGMAAAGMAFRATRLAVASRLAATPAWTRRPWASFLLGNLAGFVSEVPTFTAAARLGNAALGREQIWSGDALGHELAGGTIVLGSLKCFGFLARRAGDHFILSQAGMFAGIYTGYRIEEGLGLRPTLDQATTLTDSLATLIQFNAAGRLSHGVFGKGLGQIERELEVRGSRLFNFPTWEWAPTPISLGSHSSSTLPRGLLGPLWMMGTGGVGGGGARGPSTSPEPGPSEISSPYFQTVRRVLEANPKLRPEQFDIACGHVFVALAEEAGIPPSVWIGRSLRHTPPDVVDFWVDYYLPGESPTPTQVARAMNWIGRNRIVNGVHRVLRGLENPAWVIRAEAAGALPNLLGEGAVEPLLERLADPHKLVRIQAGNALIGLGVNVTLPELRREIEQARLSEEQSRWPQVSGRDFFSSLEISLSTQERMRAMDPPELLEIALDDSLRPRLRSFALEELMDRPDAEAYPELLQLLFEDELQIPALAALDRIHPEWDLMHRGVAAEVMRLMAREWAERFPNYRYPDKLLLALERIVGVRPRSSAL